MSATRDWITPKNWVELPMRWAHFSMTHDDPGQYDPQEWLDFFARAHVDAASLNGGGLTAFYPTKIAHHRINDKMGGGDPFGEMVEGCRKLGLFVTSRVDHHVTHESAALAHPEWIARDAQGEMIRHYEKPDLFMTCAYGPYNFGFMTQVLCEIMRQYNVDGSNHNRWGGSAMCYCDSCRASFADFCGGELPSASEILTPNVPTYRPVDAHNPAWRRFVEWRAAKIFELWDTWDAAVRAINPNACIMPGMGAEGGHVAQGGLVERAYSLFNDHQGRSGVQPVYLSGKRGKEVRSFLGGKPVGLTFNVGYSSVPNHWKDAVKSEAELRIWALDAVANDLRLKFNKFSGRLDDRRWMPMIERLYSDLWKMEPYLRERKSLARVALLYSQQTMRFYRSKGGGDASLGMYHALLEARIPFEMVHEDLLSPEQIDRYKLLILPNIACLSDAQCANLKSYVARGGSLVATHETSLCDETGARRANFGLADLFGVSAAGPVEGPMINAYLRVQHETGHPILSGFADTDRLINGSFRVPVAADVAFSDPPLTFVPSYPYTPIEDVFPRADHTGIGELYARETASGGRVVYLPSDIDRTFWSVMAPDHGQLLKNIVAWAASEEAPVVVTGQGVLDVTAWQQKGSLTVHLVNLSNPMLMKGYFREFFPVGEQQVRVQLPPSARVKKVQLLAAGQTPNYYEADGFLHVTVPTVVDHEVVAVDL